MSKSCKQVETYTNSNNNFDRQSSNYILITPCQYLDYAQQGCHNVQKTCEQCLPMFYYGHSALSITCNASCNKPTINCMLNCMG